MVWIAADVFQSTSEAATALKVYRLQPITGKTQFVLHCQLMVKFSLLSLNFLGSHVLRLGCQCEVRETFNLVLTK